MYLITIFLGKKVKGLPSEDSSAGTKVGVKRKHDETDSSDGESSDSDYDVEENVAPTNNKSGAKTSKKDGFEVVSQDPGKDVDMYFLKTTLQVYRIC